MRILFIHQNFPAQFKHLAPALVKLKHHVTALVPGPTKTKIWQGVHIENYLITTTNTKNIHPLALDFESKVIRGEACLSKALKLKEAGYCPDIIISHPGWGESLFLKEVWPTSELKLYCEFYYKGRGADFDFDPEFAQHSAWESGRANLKNSTILLQINKAVSAITPTEWQASLFPDHVRQKLTVIHEGIDTDKVQPNTDSLFKLTNKITLTAGDEVVTFVNRHLEPYRGFHIFMRSLPEIIGRNRNVKIIIVGANGVSYGSNPPDGGTWTDRMIAEVVSSLPNQAKERVFFTGTLPYDKYISLLQISTVHVYLTYPFVLSWSLLEAMSAGCAIVASDTEPVREVISHNENGILADFFDTGALAKKVNLLLNDLELRQRLANKARQHVISRYDHKTVCLPAQIKWALANHSK